MKFEWSPYSVYRVSRVQGKIRRSEDKEEKKAPRIEPTTVEEERRRGATALTTRPGRYL